MIRRLLTTAVMLLLAACQPTTNPILENAQIATVTEVDAPDRVQVTIEDGQTFPVELLGIGLAAEGTPCYQDALLFARSELEGEEVFLVQDSTDEREDGTRPRYIYKLEQGNLNSVNEAMVASGFAQVAFAPPDDGLASFYESFENGARRLNLGCWEDGEFLPGE